jgi:branched-chain amino acid transport system permease protein
MTDLTEAPARRAASNGTSASGLPSPPPLAPDEEWAVRNARRDASDRIFGEALRSFSVTAGLAAALFLPLLGVRTEPAPGGLTLAPRVDLAVYSILLVAGIRLAADVLFWRAASPSAHRVAAFSALVCGVAVGALLDSLIWGPSAALADAVAGPPGAAGGAGLHFGTELLRQTILLLGRAAPPAALGLASFHYLWRNFIPLGLSIVSTPHFVRLAAARLAAGAVVAAGGAFYLKDGSRAKFIDVMSSGLSDGGAWAGRVKIVASLLSLVAIGVFLVAAAMLIARAGRLIFHAAFARRLLPQFDINAQTADLLAKPGKDFAPALLMIAVALPLLATGSQQRYTIDTATMVMTYIMLGWGLNVVVGLAGLLDLGYVAFYAVGAYSYALLAAHFDWSFWFCLPAAGVLAALWGVALGFPVLRLRGDYLAIVTLAFGEIIRIVLINWTSLTNGSNGLSVSKLTFFGLPFNAIAENSFANTFGIEHSPIHRVIFLYYVILTLALITNFVTVRLRRLPIGRAWEALREDEIACRALGLNTTAVKLSAFATGAMFGGFAGCFYAAHHGFINPESFTFQESALILAIVVLGGLGSQTGVAVAAVALIGCSELFRELEQLRMLIFGASMVAIMTWRPQGLIAHRTPTAVLKESKAIGAVLVSQGKG